MAWNDPTAKYHPRATSRPSGPVSKPVSAWRPRRSSLARARKAIKRVRRFPLIYLGVLLYCVAAWLGAFLVTGGRLP
jgi:hypothetical protein